MIRKLQQYVCGRWCFQNAFRRIHLMALSGMGYGLPLSVEENGEINVAKRIRSRLKDGHCPVCFDVGANVGAYAAMLSKVLGPNVTIQCFEPSAAAIESLEKNTASLAGVSIHRIGLSDESGILPIYSLAGRSSLTSVYRRDLGRQVGKLQYVGNVEMTTVDIFCTIHSVECIDLLKVDVEGHELRVLQGATRMLAEGRIRAIQFEFGGTDVDSRTFFKDFWNLLSSRYNVHRVVRGGLVPISAYDERLEIFFCANYYAELRS